MALILIIFQLYFNSQGKRIIIIYLKKISLRRPDYPHYEADVFPQRKELHMYFTSGQAKKEHLMLFIMRKGLNASFAPSLIPILETFDQTTHDILFNVLNNKSTSFPGPLILPSPGASGR